MTCGTDFSGTRNRVDSPFGFLQQARKAVAVKIQMALGNGELVEPIFRVKLEIQYVSVPQVNDALLTRHSDGAPTEHRMTDTMAPGASSDCTKAYPIASDAPTTSPSRGNTSSVHGESPRAIMEPYLRNVTF